MAVFINYRREDSEGDTRAIYNRLAEETDERNLFLDFEAIGAGENWRTRIDDNLKKVQAALVVIGPRWLDILKARITAGGVDPVRSEIAACLAKDGVYVIPVIVNGARFPASDALPDDIKGLADRNAIDVRGSAWTADVERLVKTLRRVGALPTSRRRWMLRLGAAAVALAAVVAFFAARIEVPEIPKDMSYDYARDLIERHGLHFHGHKIGEQGDNRGIDVVADQRPKAGKSIFRGRTVEVDLVVKQPYVLVCRGGGSLSAKAEGDTLEFTKYDGKPSLDMPQGSCSWLTGAIVANQDPLIKPLGFKKELPERFGNAPGGFLAFCAFSQYDRGENATKSERLAVLNVQEFMRKDDNGQLQPRIGDYICIDHLE